MIHKFAIAAAVTSALMATAAPAAHAGPDAYLGEIVTVGFNFCPRGTMEADGRLLPISDNTALFSLFGTMYGGDGRTTFALPDLRGRTVIGAGQGPGLPDYRVGQKGNLESGTPALPDKNRKTQPNGAAAGSDAQPYIALKQCVVSQGLYPSRN